MAESTKRPGWRQVDSILREMAELQVAINEQIETFKTRVAKAKEDSYETVCPGRCHQANVNLTDQVAKAAQSLQTTIEPWRNHQSHLEFMLKQFIKFNYAKDVTTEKHFRFGSVHCHGDKMDVILNVGYAKAMIGKP